MIPNCSHVKFENLQQRLDFTLRKDFSKNKYKISSTLPIVLRAYSLKSRKINHKNLTLSNMSRPSIDFIVLQ